MEEHGVSTIKNLASLFGDDEAIVYVDDAIGELRVLHLVRHHDDGLACPVELREYLHDAPRGIVVEVRGRLVGEEDLRLVRDRAHDGNSLLFASAKLARDLFARTRLRESSLKLLNLFSFPQTRSYQFHHWRIVLAGSRVPIFRDYLYRETD